MAQSRGKRVMHILKRIKAKITLLLYCCMSLERDKRFVRECVCVRVVLEDKRERARGTIPSQLVEKG